jgi:hypothetical protein
MEEKDNVSGMLIDWIKFVGDLRQVSGFPLVLRFPPPKNIPPRDNRNIVDSVALSTIMGFKLTTLVVIDTDGIGSC